jgi:predicted nucleotidyltransferase component of viral defense system
VASSAGRPTDELLQLYALEGLLDRLSGSPHAEHFVLKGGALLAAFDARRPTRDVDLAAIDVTNDLDDMHRLVNEVIAIPRDDGLDFDLSATTTETIRDDEQYGGVRVTIHGMLSTAIIQFNVDINVGDPLWPPPDEIAVPRLLGGPPIRIRGYRIELVLAEKIVTALQRGTANTRWRDFVDIASLARRHLDDSALVESIRRVAAYRQSRFDRFTAPSPATRTPRNSSGLPGVASKVSPTRRRPSSGTSSTKSWRSPIHCSGGPLRVRRGRSLMRCHLPCERYTQPSRRSGWRRRCTG